MNDNLYRNYQQFDEKIHQYLVFLVHVQQSDKILIKDQLKVFDTASSIAKRILNQTQNFFSKLTEYNELERKIELEKSFNEIINEIDNEIELYRVSIDGNKLFRVDDIIETLTVRNKDILLLPSDIRNLFTYKDFDKNKKIEEQLNKDLDELRKKQDEELAEFKLKAFMELLTKESNENVNPDLFYKINKKILYETPIKDINYIEGHEDEDTLKNGTFFIKAQKELKVIQKKDGLSIRYSINILDAGTDFIVHIQGSIKVGEQEESFRIYERYSDKQATAVLNGYKLKELIEIFNELFIEKYRKNDQSANKRNDIDDYLNGKISR